MNYKVTARRFRVNTVVVKDSKYYILRQHIFILASVIRHANLTFSAPTMASLATAYFSMLSHERHNFVKKNNFEQKICVLIFSTTFVWNIFHFTKNSARYYHK